MTSFQCRIFTKKLLCLGFIALLSTNVLLVSVQADYVKPEETSEVRQLRTDIAGYAQNFVGVRYRSAGTSPRTGFDCSGFTTYIMKEFGINLTRSSSSQANEGTSVSLKDVKPGDLVFFGGKKCIHHVGIVVENTDEGIRFVHSSSSGGVVVENINDSKYWSRKIVCARNILGGK